MIDEGTNLFPRTARLTRPRQFRWVFAAPEQRSNDRYFTVLAKANESPRCRLGLAIAKKHIRRAVDRNRIKRLVRESFRQTRQDLTGLDLVVLARAGTAAQQNTQLRDSLARHWRRLSRPSAI